eukprot:286265_1
MSTFLIAIALLLCKHTEFVICTDVSNVYINPHTLTLASSPYFVRNDVEIRSTATLTIENGVEIIFMDAYTINVYGSINSGCSVFNTSSINNTTGLANTNTFTLIRGNSSLTHVGRIKIITTSGTNLYTSFCNTRFNNMDLALYITGTTYYKYSCDNCEFINLNYGIYDTSNTRINYITDSLFSNINYVNYDGNIIFDNCKFDLKNNGKFYYGSMTRT